MVCKRHVWHKIVPKFKQLVKPVEKLDKQTLKLDQVYKMVYEHLRQQMGILHEYIDEFNDNFWYISIHVFGINLEQM